MAGLRRPRRLLAAGLVLAATAAPSVVAAAQPAHAAATTRTQATPTLSSVWHGTSWSVAIALRGRASPGTTISATTPCAIGTCTAQTTATTKRRYALRLDAVIPPGTRSITVTVRKRTQVTTHRLAVTPPTATAPGARAVMVIGDSLAVSGAATLAALLPSRTVTTQAAVGRTLQQGMDIFAHTPLDARISIAVFSLFTNDDPLHVDALLHRVKASLTRLGARRCAVWFTIRRPAINKVSYQPANRALLALAADPSTGGRLQIVDWYAAVAANHRLVGKDRVHPTTAGIAVRARLAAAAIERCPR